MTVEFKSPNLLNLSISSKDLFSNKRFRDERSTETDSSRATVVVSPNLKKVRIAGELHTSARKKDAVRQVPVGQYDVGARPAAFVYSLKDFLLPQTIQAHSSKNVESLIEESIGNLYHSFQSTLMLQEAYAVEMRRFKDTEAEHAKCEEKLRAVQARASDLSKSLKQVQHEYDDFAKKATEMNNKFANDTKEVIIEHIMHTRAEVMLEYKRGEWEHWNVDETVNEFNEKYPARPIVVNAAEESGHQPFTEEAQDGDDDQDDELEDVQEDALDDVQNQASDDE